MTSAIARLAKAFDSRELPWRQDVALSELSTWRIGGTGDIIVEPETPEGVNAAVQILNDMGMHFIAIGDGSNLLFDDEGYRGAIIKIGANLSKFSISDDGIVNAEAGLWAPCFVRRTVKAGLAGCVHAAGIPGTIGGLVIMNGGTQRKGIGSHVVDVTFVDECGTLRIFNQDQCQFSYRRSILQSRKIVVVSVKFKYQSGSISEMRREMLAILKERNQKFPRKSANCGSVFLSDPSLYETLGPPGMAIEKVGMKGYSWGRAQISPSHANFIVNNCGATSKDVLQLIRQIRHKVFDATGIWMNCEVRHVQPNGAIQPAHVAANVLAASV